MPDPIAIGSILPVHSGIMDVADMTVKPGHVDGIASAVPISQEFIFIIDSVSIFPPITGNIAAVELDLCTGGNLRKDKFPGGIFDFGQFPDIGFQAAVRMDRVAVVPDHSVDIPCTFIFQ